MQAAIDVDIEDDSPPTVPVACVGARVLVVEDDDALRGLVVETLASGGFDVNEANSGRDALATLESMGLDAWPAKGVDIVVVDMCMPGLNGLDVIRSLRRSPWPTPTILMTAFPSPDVITEARRLGALVLAKPFALHVLTRATVALLVGRDSANDNDPLRGVRWS